MSAYVVTFEATSPICVNVAASVDRSIWKPDSLDALSVHVRLIWLVDTAVALKVVGAAGAVGAGPLLRRTIGAIDGTPAAFSTNSM